MTAAARDPLTIAREVLETAHEDETVTVCSVPDNKAAALAHAVIDLTTKVERMEALADRLENEAAYEASRGDTWDATCIRAEARRIRRALNGDDQ